MLLIIVAESEEVARMTVFIAFFVWIFFAEVFGRV